MRPATLSITASDTIDSVFRYKSHLVRHHIEELTELLREREEAEFLLLEGDDIDQRIEVHRVADATMGELNEAMNAIGSEDCIFVLLGIVSGLEREQIMKLRFLRAYRAYLTALDDLQGVMNAWRRLSDKEGGGEATKGSWLAATVRSLAKFTNETYESVSALPWGVVWIWFDEKKKEDQRREAERKQREQQQAMRARSARARGGRR